MTEPIAAGVLPYLIILACPLMHCVMHGKHGHGASHDHDHRGQGDKRE